MKVLIDFINKDNIRTDVDYLIGIEGFSYNILYKYSLNEVLEIVNLLHSKNIVCGVNLEKIMFDQDLENLKKVVERYKTLAIALIVLFALALLSLVISLISKDVKELLVPEKLYILVMAVTLVGSILFFILFIKNKNKLKELNK